MMSYWLESTKDNRKEFDKLEKDINTDVCIIGGGLTGLTTAYYLKNSGLNVVLLEKDKLCNHTSGNTTAKITSQHHLFYKYLVDLKGKEFAKQYLKANEEAIKNIETIIKEENIQCDFEYQDSYVFTQKLDEIELTGNGFLYNMVRIIAGTLVDVGLGKIETNQIPEIIESKDRQKAGKTLPAHGLYLVKVEY